MSSPWMLFLMRGGAGSAYRLCERCIRVLAKEKIRTAVLEVSARNLPAQRLYEKLQYRYLETVYGYYQGREDAYRMVRTNFQASHEFHEK